MVLTIPARLRLHVGAEVVAGAALGDLHVALAASAGGVALDGLDGPVEAAASAAGVGAGGAALPLTVPGIATAAAAQGVSAAVARTERGGTLGHLANRLKEHKQKDMKESAKTSDKTHCTFVSGKVVTS